MVQSALRVHKRNLIITDHLLEVIQLGGANNRSSDPLRAPGKCDLGHPDSLLSGEFLDSRS